MKKRKINWKGSLADTFDSNSRKLSTIQRCALSPQALKNVSLISAQDPGEMARVFGRAGSRRNIFIDQCASYHLTIPAHILLGRATVQFFASPKKGNIHLKIESPDKLVYAFAKQESFDVILTYDGHHGKSEDLCEVARQAYATDKEDKNPGVVVLPHTPQDAIATLVDEQRKIREYLEKPIKKPLDLRR